MTLTAIPTTLGVAGAHLAKGGAAGSPDLYTLLEEHRAALATLQGASNIYAAVADTDAIKAIGAGDRADGMLVEEKAAGGLWRFDANSAAAGSATVLVPNAGTGRWVAIGNPATIILAAAAVPKASVQYGTVALVAGTATVSTKNVTAGSVIVPILGYGAKGDLTVSGKTPGAPGSFVLTSDDNTDTSTAAYLIIG